jgi:hypothetical protein
MTKVVQIKYLPFAQPVTIHGLAMELSHMIADKTIQEIEQGNIKTVPHRSTVDLFKEC